ncbi:tetraacyldisaccharide 4'-kinase [Alcaligenaceae bacterium A4P071]|nr:tetraacyldisaccharide 4'-kinase [Alcaligenaceae bacterium A4P071]
MSAAWWARQWQRKGWVSNALLPLAALTRLVVARKRRAFAEGRRAAHWPGVPVVVIGNIYVGGTGKTPAVIATVEALRARGWRPGVVSRGYGVAIGPTARVAQGTPEAAQVGDEPALIARVTRVPIAVHPRRVLAAQALRDHYPEIDVIVSDDGLQHLALARDVEIVIQDERGVGNGRVLPAGPLREPPERLREVDAIVSNRSGAVVASSGASPSAVDPSSATPSAPRSAASSPSSADSPSAAAAPLSAVGPHHLDMRLEPSDAVRLIDGQRRPLADFAAPALGPIAAAAGIGKPERFFATLTRAGIPLVHTLSLPDHHDFKTSPFGSLTAATILITEKDAIKCAHLQDARLWSVPVKAELSDPAFFDWLSLTLAERRDARLASGAPHGNRP